MIPLKVSQAASDIACFIDIGHELRSVIER